MTWGSLISKIINGFFWDCSAMDYISKALLIYAIAEKGVET